MADRIIEIRRILYSLDPEILLPSGIHVDGDSLRKVLQLFSKTTSRENIKSICEQVLNVLKKSTDDCLRKCFVQALSTNDVEKAQLCMNILKNKNHIFVDNFENDISSISGNIYSSFLKNLSLLSNKKDNFNQSYRADESVCLIRANSELNFKPLPVILETQSQAELAINHNTYLLKATKKQMHNGEDSCLINNHTGNKKKQQASRPKPLALNDSSDSEPVPFPKSLLGFEQPATDKNNVSKSIEKFKSVPTHRDHDSKHQDESQDSEDLFWPPTYKKSPQNKRRLEESNPERGGGKHRNRNSSNMFSPVRQSARKAYLSKHRANRKEDTSSSDSECETTRKINKQDIGGYKKHSTEYLRKRRYSDSDIPSTSEKTVRISKSKQYENNNSNFEKNTRKGLKINKNKSTKRRKKYHSDSMEHELSSPEKVMRTDQHITSKRVKLPVSCSSETSSSPATVIYKHANKKLKGEIRESSHSESETDLDSNPKGKTSQRGKNYKVLEYKTRTSNKMSKKAPVSKQMPTNSKNKTVKYKPSEHIKKKYIESVESWEDTSENCSSFSESESESERLNNFKFMPRLKKLESSILQGNSDSLGANTTKNKNNKSPTVPKKNSKIVSNKAKTNKKSSAVSSKKPPAVSSKKSPAVSSKISTEVSNNKASAAVSSKKSSAVSSKKAPAVSNKKSPAVSSKKSPAVSSKKSSAVSSKKSSAVSSKKSPEVSNKISAAVSSKKSSAVSSKKSPAVSSKKSPAVSSKKSPAVSSKKSCVVTKKKTPAVTKKKSPAVTKKKSPAVTKKKSPAVTMEKSPLVVKSNGDTNKYSSLLKNNKKPMNSKRNSVVKPAKTNKPGAVKNKKNVNSQAKKGSGSVQTNRKRVTGNKKQNDEPTISEDETVSPHNNKITGETSKKNVILSRKNVTDSNDKEREETGNSSLSSDESFMSDLEMEPQIGSLSTCLNSIKKKLPRQVGTATPPIKMFLSANSDAISEASADSFFDKIPVKFNDKNIIKRMAKANKPKETESDQPTFSNVNGEANNTPEALRKVMKINKKFEEKHDSEIECSSFSDS